MCSRSFKAKATTATTTKEAVAASAEAAFAGGGCFNNYIIVVGTGRCMKTPFQSQDAENGKS